MRRIFLISVALLLVLFSATRLKAQEQSVNTPQQPQETPAVVTPSDWDGQLAIASKDSQPSPEQIHRSMRAHFRACDQSLGAAREHAHALAKEAQKQSFDSEAIHTRHQQLKEQVRTIQKNREQLLSDLSEEQQKTIQDHHKSMQELHESIQGHLQAIDLELTGPNLHLETVAVEAKAAERDIKAYVKHLQETGKAFNLLND